MYGSPPVSKDLNHPFPPPPPPSSDHHRRHHQQQQQHQMSSGLLRYRSAPSTLLGDLCEDFLPVRPSSPETETVFARFLGSDLRPEIRDKPAAAMKDIAAAGGGGFSAPQMLYRPPQHQQQQQMPSHNPVDAAYRVVGLETEQIKGGGSSGNSSNLIRHSSSPAGLFAQLNVENGYGGMMRGMGGGSSGGGGGGYRNGNGAMGEVASPSSAAAAVAASRLKGQISFSSRQNSASSSGLMSQISEEIEGISPDGDGGNCRYMPTGFPTGSSWDDSALLSDGFSGLKRGRSVDAKLVTGLNQSEPPRNGIGSTDMSALEKFLQFQDSVPCKIRAKRGCATHPRSIAERVRRTRISERMRKLQELVPNMDKQTNTADMLDLAVEHIKDLQREVKNLSDSRASCTCSSSKHKPYSKPGV